MYPEFNMEESRSEQRKSQHFDYYSHSMQSSLNARIFPIQKFSSILIQDPFLSYEYQPSKKFASPEHSKKLVLAKFIQTFNKTGYSGSHCLLSEDRTRQEGKEDHVHVQTFCSKRSLLAPNILLSSQLRQTISGNCRIGVLLVCRPPELHVLGNQFMNYCIEFTYVQ